jgi:hypothetical protein
MKETEFLRKRNVIPKDGTDLIIGFNNGTKESLIGLLKEYHESELKNFRVTDVSNRRELLIAFMESLTTEDLTQIEIAEFDNVANKFLGN